MPLDDDTPPESVGDLMYRDEQEQTVIITVWARNMTIEGRMTNYQIELSLENAADLRDKLIAFLSPVVWN